MGQSTNQIALSMFTVGWSIKKVGQWSYKFPGPVWNANPPLLRTQKKDSEMLRVLTGKNRFSIVTFIDSLL